MSGWMPDAGKRVAHSRLLLAHRFSFFPALRFDILVIFGAEVILGDGLYPGIQRIVAVVVGFARTSDGHKSPAGRHLRTSRGIPIRS